MGNQKNKHGGHRVVVQELVSVIMPTYNRGYIIGEALESLRKQDYRNFEVIVVDDGSGDETADVVGTFPDLDIKYIKLEKNQGANHARNIGIGHASGKYIAFLDSDNEYLPQNLSIKMKMISGASDKVGFVFGSFFRVSAEKKEIRPFVEWNNDIKEDLRKLILRFNVIDTSTVIAKKECFQNTGLFDETFPRLQDWDMFSRILFDGGYEALFCEEPLCVNKLQKDSLTTSQDKYFEAKTRFYKKRLPDYKRYFDTKEIFDIYAITDNTFKGISLYRRMEGLLSLGFTEGDWDAWENAWNCRIDKYKRNNRNLAVFNKWVTAEEKGYRISDWLKKNNFNKIAVYGYGYLGKHLVYELSGDGVEIVYILDKNPDTEHPVIKVCHELDDILNVDVIIVTAVNYFEDIQNELGTRTSASIVSISDILDEIS